MEPGTSSRQDVRIGKMENVGHTCPACGRYMAVHGRRRCWRCRLTRRPDAPMEVHTIPVPRLWTPEHAWAAIGRGELLPDPKPRWANIEVQAGEMLRWL